MATTKQKKSKHLEESTEKRLFSDGINQIEQGICNIITVFGQLEQKIHSDTEKDNLETLKATISTLKAEREEQDLIHDSKIKQLADEESQEKKRLLNGFVSQKNEMLNENELLMKKIAELCMDTERNESIWKEGENQLKQLLAKEKINTQDAHGEIEKWQIKEEMGKSQTKVLEKEIEAKRIDLMNTKAYIKRSEDAWQKEQAMLRDDIEVEKRNCQRALEAFDILQTREKGFEKEMERKRKLIDENFVIRNDNLNLKKDLDQKAKDYNKLVATVKEKEHEMISVITSNNKLNKETLTLKESLIETENRLTTLQGTYDKTKERLCKAELHLAVVQDDKDRQYKEDDYRTGRRNASTMDNRSNSKRHKMALESTINFGRHRDTFRIARKNQERNELIERLKKMEDGQKVQQTVLEQMEQRAISTEQQLKDKQTENEYLERTIERLQTELKGSKLRHVYLFIYHDGQSI
ncbi:A-kinase anchor protein 9-like [Mytilus trossulus]|uniref:A-kinase anchor protein 9-like n=1 Tax=Mytilus trossulus TaxID=6551 RepID=UPI003006AE3F